MTTDCSQPNSHLPTAAEWHVSYLSASDRCAGNRYILNSIFAVVCLTMADELMRNELGAIRTLLKGHVPAVSRKAKCCRDVITPRVSCFATWNEYKTIESTTSIVPTNVVSPIGNARRLRNFSPEPIPGGNLHSIASRAIAGEWDGTRDRFVDSLPHQRRLGDTEWKIP